VAENAFWVFASSKILFQKLKLVGFLSFPHIFDGKFGAFGQTALLRSEPPRLHGWASVARILAHVVNSQHPLQRHRLAAIAFLRIMLPDDLQ
jgi:hypothetical protein